ncbi:exodeoxyribonuclease VII large subunit [Hoyosella sp. YIM 151337]|nr:exodeoxyribonuclease VII large subunit [Hoyosella sp. YIM 151337]MCW4355067.1 exodeoxyribonuclease VII large subunit [Hoyosella sp. YIM 151337]
MVSSKITQWIDRLGAVWVEGQITQISLRPGTRTAFLVLRDPSADISLPVTCSPMLLTNSPVELTEGTRVVALGKPTFFPGRGSFSLRVTDIRPVGLGELLARIERLKALLRAEGLFDDRLKRPLPYLPRCVGLITGRASAAERDVLSVAQRRWPDVQFAVRNTAVQGPGAAAQVIGALRELDADPDVDVIILARGGGSVEDLLPFSDEALCRTIVGATTPIISAIGHEPDNPLCDYVADVRAATPTDAAKRAVPDVVAELALLRELRSRSVAALRTWVTREEHAVTQLRSRPVLAAPIRSLEERGADVERCRTQVRREVDRVLNAAAADLSHIRARLTALGPAATLERGYAVVQAIHRDGGPPHVVTAAGDAPPGTGLRIRVTDGVFRATAGDAERGTGHKSPKGTADD